MTYVICLRYVQSIIGTICKNHLNNYCTKLPFHPQHTNARGWLDPCTKALPPLNKSNIFDYSVVHILPLLLKRLRNLTWTLDQRLSNRPLWLWMKRGCCSSGMPSICTRHTKNNAIEKKNKGVVGPLCSHPKQSEWGKNNAAGVTERRGSTLYCILRFNEASVENSALHAKRSGKHHTPHRDSNKGYTRNSKQKKRTAIYIHSENNAWAVKKSKQSEKKKKSHRRKIWYMYTKMFKALTNYSKQVT